MNSATEAKQVAHTPDFSQGQQLYEQANDARRNGDHDGYNRLCLELIDYNSRAALSKAGAA